MSAAKNGAQPINNDTVDIRARALTHTDPAGGQLQQRTLKVLAGAGERPSEPEQLHSALQTDLRKVLEHTSWEGTYWKTSV